MGDLTREKKLVAMTFVFVFVTFLSMAVFMEQTVTLSKYGKDSSFAGDQAVGYTSVSADASSYPPKIKADVKGSIYETGSNMTVFGSCMDGDGYLLPEATASFTAWYPNGSIVTGPNASMLKIYDDINGYSPNGTGRWLIHVTMGDTIGTYLTEMRCEYQGQWATATGEWQNPEWVKKIGDTYLSVNNMSTVVDGISTVVNNMSSSLTQFRNDTQNNFSTVINEINSISAAVVAGTATPEMVNELSRLIHSIDYNVWTLDAKNPFFSLASGVNNFYAVDMLGPNNVHAGGDGVVAKWDGQTWTLTNVTGSKFYGVSVLPATMPYAWYAGETSGTPVVSVNGAAPFTPTLPGDTSTALSDIKIFQRPNDPSGAFYGYILANDGRVYFSQDSGGNWSYVASVGNGSGGRLSEVIENVGEDAEPLGYVLMAGQGNQVMTYDDGIVNTYPVNGNVKGVSLLYHNLGYVLTHGTDDLAHVYVWNETNLTEQYVVNDTGIVPVGIAAVASNDVWMVTQNPSTFYHYDGTMWDYATVPFGSFVSIIIGFGNVTFTSGINDVVMWNGKFGYAVGGDGLVLIYQNHYDTRLDEMMANLTAQLGNIQVNMTPVMNAVQEVNLTTQQTLTIVQQMNLTVGEMQQAMNGNFTSINSKLDALNLSDAQELLLLSSINGTVMSIENSQIYMQGFLNAMNISIGQSFLDLNGMLSLMNFSITSQLNTIQSTLDAMNLTLVDIQNVANGNFTQINTKLDNLQLSQNAQDLVLSYINSTVTTTLSEMYVTQGMIQNVNGTVQNINANVLVINQTVTNTYDAVMAMNASIMGDLTALSNKIDQINSSMQYKLDNILTNVTYSQLYMETTLYPMVNATYQNTVLILQNLGILQASVNQTIQLQNTTLGIVNATDQKVDQLLNKSNRIRAWVTQ